jgi:ribosomal-protein-alanine N-acetyltransferase
MSPAELAQLHAACFTTPRPWTEVEFRELIASPGVFLLSRGGTAMVMGRVVLDEVELLTIATHPDHRGQGIATQLLRDFETQARAKAATDAYLEVAADNFAARALYLAAGWAITGRRPKYYQTPDGGRIDAEIMGKSLP